MTQHLHFPVAAEPFLQKETSSPSATTTTIFCLVKPQRNCCILILKYEKEENERMKNTTKSCPSTFFAFCLVNAGVCLGLSRKLINFIFSNYSYPCLKRISWVVYELTTTQTFFLRIRWLKEQRPNQTFIMCNESSPKKEVLPFFTRSTEFESVKRKRLSISISFSHFLFTFVFPLLTKEYTFLYFWEAGSFSIFFFPLAEFSWKYCRRKNCYYHFLVSPQDITFFWHCASYKKRSSR